MTSDASLEGSSNANATSTLSPDIRPTLPPNVSVKDLDELYQLILQREKEPCFRLKEWYYNSPELHKPKEFYLDRHDSTENTYSCYYPDDRCWKDNSRPIFATALALEGHYKDVHHGRYRPPSCDYLGCVWAPESQFPERENCRDHYSMAHGERVVSFKSHSQEEKRQLEAERNILLDHWRCAECLHRVGYQFNSWTCPSCAIEFGLPEDLIGRRTNSIPLLLSMEKIFKEKRYSMVRAQLSKSSSELVIQTYGYLSMCVSGRLIQMIRRLWAWGI